MTLDYEAAEAAGLCECGTPLDEHPPLPAPKSWAAGRPCSKTSIDRGHGWDGRPAVDHTAGELRRWKGYGSGLAQPTAPASSAAGSHSVAVLPAAANVELAAEPRRRGSGAGPTG